MTEVKKTNPATGLKSIELYYSPIENRDFGGIVAYRCRPRINDEKMGVLLHETYMPVIERSALCESFTLYIIESVAHDAARLRARNIGFDWLSIFVPVSVLRSDNFADRVNEALAKVGLSADGLCFEFPMALLYEDTEKTTATLDALRSLGIKTLLCDYGSKYCPTVMITTMKTDIVMIGREVTEMLLSENLLEVEMAGAVFKTAKSQDIDIIADGIDTREVLDRLPRDCAMHTGRIAGRQKKLASIR